MSFCCSTRGHGDTGLLLVTVGTSPSSEEAGSVITWAFALIPCSLGSCLEKGTDKKTKEREKRGLSAAVTEREALAQPGPLCPAAPCGTCRGRSAPPLGGAVPQGAGLKERGAGPAGAAASAGSAGAAASAARSRQHEQGHPAHAENAKRGEIASGVGAVVTRPRGGMRGLGRLHRGCHLISRGNGNS